MRPSTALRDHLEQVRAIIARYPVRNARFFGSTSRGDDRDGSDLDILVEPTEVTTLFDLAGLKLELEALLGIRVDIATPGALPASVDQAISDDLRPLRKSIEPRTISYKISSTGESEPCVTQRH